MTTQDNRGTGDNQSKKRRLNRQIESVGWALFLIWSGALLIAPDGFFPKGTWLIGIGLIITLSMGFRFLYGIGIDGFWMASGFLALGFGISEFFSLHLSVFPVFLIIIGVVIAYKAIYRKNSHKQYFRGYRWNRQYFWGCGRHRRDFWGCGRYMRSFWGHRRLRRDFWDNCCKSENGKRA